MRKLFQKIRLLLFICLALLVFITNAGYAQSPFTEPAEIRLSQGGDYHLVQEIPVTRYTSGGDYQLQIQPEGSQIRGNGCCCVFLPLICEE